MLMRLNRQKSVEKNKIAYQASGDLKQLMDNIDYNFKNQALLELAISHCSVGSKNNERLEFLGDSVLSFIIASELYRRFPKAKEGPLSRLRANLVCESTLAELAREFGVGSVLRFGCGEMKSGGANRASILADAVEALIGAIYLDSGIRECYIRVVAWFNERLENLSLSDVHKDPKSKLQEFLQSQQYSLPRYSLVEIKGKEHKQIFVIECRVPLLDHPVVAEGSSRRKAEQKAAELTLKELAIEY